MAPVLHDSRHAIRAMGVAESPSADVFALIREQEGWTIILPDPLGDWARISLAVHSDLTAVGLTAAISGALAAAGIAANVVAGFHHDHILVLWERRQEALDIINSLGDEA
jgi:hypothetical protein